MIAVHVLEHFYEWEAVPLLTEWKRVLKPGGKLILELPCMNKVFQYIHACLQEKQPLWAQLSWWAFWGDHRYQDPAMCHKWGYSIDMLQEALQQAGFERVTMEPPRYHIPQRDMRCVAYKGAA